MLEDDGSSRPKSCFAGTRHGPSSEMTASTGQSLTSFGARNLTACHWSSPIGQSVYRNMQCNDCAHPPSSRLHYLTCVTSHRGERRRCVCVCGCVCAYACACACAGAAAAVSLQRLSSAKAMPVLALVAISQGFAHRRPIPTGHTNCNQWPR